MFGFIKNLFSTKPQEEPVVEVEVKPKRKYKPRAPKVKVEEVVEAIAQEVVEQVAPVLEPPRPRIMARQLVGAATPVAKPEPVVEPVVEEPKAVKKAPAKKKPVTPKPEATKPVVSEVVEQLVEQVFEISDIIPVIEKPVEPQTVEPTKPATNQKALLNKSPRKKKKR